MAEDKPPIGLIPEGIWRDHVQSDRVGELLAAITRYYNAKMACPVAWLDELKRHVCNRE